MDCENHSVEAVSSYQKQIDALQSQIQEKDEEATGPEFCSS